MDPPVGADPTVFHTSDDICAFILKANTMGEPLVHNGRVCIKWEGLFLAMCIKKFHDYYDAMEKYKKKYKNIFEKPFMFKQMGGKFSLFSQTSL